MSLLPFKVTATAEPGHLCIPLFLSTIWSLPLALFMVMWQPAVSVPSAVWCENCPLLSALLRKRWACEQVLAQVKCSAARGPAGAVMTAVTFLTRWFTGIKDFMLCLFWSALICSQLSLCRIFIFLSIVWEAEPALFKCSESRRICKASQDVEGWEQWDGYHAHYSC